MRVVAYNGARVRRCEGARVRSARVRRCEGATVRGSESATMKIIDLGSGTPVVLVPGIQGRWEWLRPGVEALARSCRVITFSLADEPTSGGTFNEADGFTSYIDQISEAMDASGVKKAVVCGVSYGGLIAAAFAARHPERVSGLVLVSAIPPDWQPDSRVRFYLRAPVLLSPLFCFASVRMHPEIAAAAPGFLSGITTSARCARTALRYIFSPTRMARRIQLLETLELRRELAAVKVPTLVITGEPALDRVVPVRRTRDYLAIWPHAVGATIARTGHLGVITRPAEFARIVTPFAQQASYEQDRRRHVV
jgi:pimeloyl-ACP methyl ester carboxylesterase